MIDLSDAASDKIAALKAAADDWKLDVIPKNTKQNRKTRLGKQLDDGIAAAADSEHSHKAPLHVNTLQLDDDWKLDLVEKESKYERKRRLGIQYNDAMGDDIPVETNTAQLGYYDIDDDFSKPVELTKK